MASMFLLGPEYYYSIEIERLDRGSVRDGALAFSRDILLLIVIIHS